MFRRCLVKSSIMMVSVAALSLSVRADPAYEFVTLYSPDKPSVTDLPTAGPYRAEPRNEFADHSLAGNRQMPWEKRIPWWREEAIERGPLAPYDQQSTFEQSLEAGRAYPEASRKYQRTNDTNPAAADSRTGTQYRGTDFSSAIPIVAAVLWKNGRRQAETLTALPERGPVTQYKGVSLIGSSYPGIDNEDFFAMMRKAIDMTAMLPQSLQKYSSLIDKVIFDPPSEFRGAKGAALDFDGVYMITDVRKKAPIVLYKDARFSSPLQISMSLLGGGVLAARHERLIQLLKGAGDTAESREEINDRLASVSTTDPALLNEAECQLQMIFHEADKAFDVGQAKVGARLQLMRQRQCR